MEPILGTICLFGFNFPPRGWAFCDGSLLSISQNSALFALLGTMYGGDGVTTFALPDLRGRVPVGQGSGPGLSPYTIGQMGGNESVTLTANQMPMHNHALIGSTDAATSNSPNGSILAASNAALEDGTPVTANTYGTSNAANATLDPKSISIAGGSQPTPIVQPYLGMNYCIALEGVFPSRN